MKWREVLTYLCFVALATAIWYGRALRSVHDKTLSVEVQYVGIPGTVSLDTPLPDRLTIQVRDAGTRLRLYSDAPLTVSIDLTGRFHSSSGEVTISSETLKTAVKQQLQGTTNLQKISPSIIRSTYRTQTQKRVPVILHHQIECAPEYQLAEEPLLMQSSILAYGAKEALDSLESVQTKTLVLDDARDTILSSVGLIAPKGIRLSQGSVKVQVVAERYSEKVITVPIEIKNVPEGSRVRLFPQQATVTLHVGLSHWKNIHDNDIHAYCVYSDSLETLPVEVRSENSEVMRMRVHPSTVEYLIEHN